MAYRITAFNGVTLTAARLDVGRGEIRSPFSESPWGVTDTLGADDANLSLPGSLPLTAQVEADSQAAFKTAWDSLLAIHGTRGTLTRTSDGGTAQTIDARCTRITANRLPHDRTFLRYNIDFALLSGTWDGADATVDTVLDTTPKNITCDNDGNKRVDDAVITVTAKGSAITALTVAVTGVTSITWTGTLAVDDALVIDCGAHTIQNDGANAYATLTFNAGHVVSQWLRLEPGSNTVAVTRTGGDATTTIGIAYSEGWY